jgi:hypothetical protein
MPALAPGGQGVHDPKRFDGHSLVRARSRICIAHLELRDWMPIVERCSWRGSGVLYARTRTAARSHSHNTAVIRVSVSGEHYPSPPELPSFFFSSSGRWLAPILVEISMLRAQARRKYRRLDSVPLNEQLSHRRHIDPRRAHRERSRRRASSERELERERERMKCNRFLMRSSRGRPLWGCDPWCLTRGSRGVRRMPSDLTRRCAGRKRWMIGIAPDAQLRISTAHGPLNSWTELISTPL